MLNRVLGPKSFDRAVKRSVKLLLFVLIIATTTVGGATVAHASGAADPVSVVTKDANGDGHIDHIELTFGVAMDATKIPTGYSVAGYALANQPAAWVNKTPANTATILDLNLIPDFTNNGDTGVKPVVTYTSGGTAKSQTAAGNQETTAGPTVATTDGAAPALMRVLAKDFGAYATFNEIGDEMDFVFSEPVTLNGVTASDKLTSLQNSLKFSPIRAGATCDDGATAKPPKSNFPKVAAAQSSDPSVDPVSFSGNTIKVVMKAGDSNSDIANVANPGFCGVGVVSNAATGAPAITDLSSPTANAAATEDAGGANSGRRDINTLPTEVLQSGIPPVAQVKTQDLSPHVNTLGYIDAIKVQFEQPLDPGSIAKTPLSKFAVSLGAAHATVTSIGQGPSNDSLYIRITTPAKAPWGGDQTPTVSFDGSPCTQPDGTSCTLQAEVPTRGKSYTDNPWTGFTARVDSFNVTSIIGVGPAIVSGNTVDSGKSGFIDQIQLTLTKPLATPAGIGGWKVAGVPISKIDTNTAAKTATLTLGQSTLRTDAVPIVSYDETAGTAADAQGIPLNTQTYAPTDGASPRLVSATTQSSKNDGNIDGIKLQFSEPVDGSVLHASDFTVGSDNATPSSFSPAGNVVTLAVSEPGTTSIPVNFSGTLQDLSPQKNFNKDAIHLAASAVHDGVAPVKVTVSTNPAGVAKAQTVTVTATYSEPLDTSVAPVVKIDTKKLTPVSDASHTANGYATDDSKTWSGSYTFTSADCAGTQNGCAYGITLSGFKDVAGNLAQDASGGTIVIDTVAPDAPTGDSVASQQHAGYPSIAANTIGSHTDNLTITANITASQVNTFGDASGGNATLLLDGQALSPSVSISNIAASATSISVNTAFADARALQTAIAEGTHTFSIQLCDTAGNCSTSKGVSVTADYTPVTPTLTAPNSGSFTGGDKVCISWTTPAATDLQATELRFSTDGGQTFPNLIDSNATQTACGAGTGYQWTVPSANTDQLRVQVRTIDQYANDATSASSSNMSVTTVTQTVLSLRANAATVVYGQTQTLTGSLTGSGFAVAGKTVHLQSKPAGASDFSTLQDVTTGDDGAFSYTFKPSLNAQYQAVFDKTGPYLASSSNIEATRVATNVTSWVSSSNLRKGQTLTFGGNVWPTKSGHPVYFQVLRGRAWATLSRITLAGKSAYSFRYRAGSAGKLMFRVIYYGDSFNAGNVSKSYLISWR